MLQAWHCAPACPAPDLMSALAFTVTFILFFAFVEQLCISTSLTLQWDSALSQENRGPLFLVSSLFSPLVLFGSQGGPSIMAVCRGGQHSLGQCVVCLKAEVEVDPAERSSCMPETQNAKLTFLFPAIPP